MIEILAESRSHDSLPAGGGVTGLTTLLPEASFVRIAVAVIAFREGKSHVARLFIGSRRVTLFAFHLPVLPGERIAGLRVIEGAGDIFPVREVVAGNAIRPEASAMWIFVAGGTGFGDANKTVVEVFDFDQCALSGGNMFRSMALLALHTRMLALERVARLFVVEGLRVPLDQREVEPVMIGVALRALLAGARPDSIREVQSLASRKPLCNFPVAVKALENRLSAQFVAGRATRRAFQILVSAGQSAR